MLDLYHMLETGKGPKFKENPDMLDEVSLHINRELPYIPT